MDRAAGFTKSLAARGSAKPTPGKKGDRICAETGFARKTSRRKRPYSCGVDFDFDRKGKGPAAIVRHREKRSRCRCSPASGACDCRLDRSGADQEETGRGA